MHFGGGKGDPEASAVGGSGACRVERAARPLADAARVGHLPQRQPRRAIQRAGSLREMLPAGRRKPRAGRPFHPDRLIAARYQCHAERLFPVCNRIGDVTSENIAHP